ncbi:unnamed protein product [Hymenolepis diminuta]|uniref:Integrase catalytic domain-containing protein n=1 Tax=Hymenolepis diminuta TaxID=6216 RepID=A0A564YBH9_HYMDI|nr:unnamed protein product [Hymenolepis diminuta]
MIAVDASKYGATITHVFADGSEKSVVHDSRTLTTVKKGYRKIERASLAVIFAVKKFNKLLYCKHFTLLTDHKSLHSIIGSKNGIPVYTARRLRCWLTILLGHGFEIYYRNTAEFRQANCLSRRIGDLQNVTVKDSVLKKAMKYTLTGRPKSDQKGDLLQLYGRRDKLTVITSCLMFIDHVVISLALKRAVLQPFYSSHPGVNHTESIARTFYTGLVTFKVTRIYSIKLHHDCRVGRSLHHVFSTHGLSKIILTDNSTKFSSALFQDFCRSHNNTHVYPPPHHTYSNGQTERFFDGLKWTLQESREKEKTEEILYELLLT